jgi:RNA 2',3'-cyclic 3'-phosphodiesterase
VSGSAVARMFVAGDLPADVASRLADWTREALRSASRPAGSSQIRLLEAGLMHVTIHFLGDRLLADVDAMSASLAACVHRVEGLSLGAPVWLPARRPRALAVEVHDDAGQLHALHSAVCAALAEPETRRYRPHVTVARMSTGAAPRMRELGEPTPALTFALESVTLYRSRLERQGASYEALASIAM